MSFLIREGRAQFGAEPSNVLGYLINRTANAMLLGEPLICDTTNASFAADASEGGVFGNGITPVIANVVQQSVAPIGVATRSGAALGERVPVIFHGVCTVRCNSAGAIAQGIGALQVATAQRFITLTTGSLNNLRFMGWNHGAHGGTGAETIVCYYNGISMRAG